MGFLYSILGKASILAGRDKRCDLVLDAPYISHIQFIIRILEDGSVAQIKVEGRNGIRINHSLFKKGERIIINRSSIIVFGAFALIYLKNYIYLAAIDDRVKLEQCVSSQLTRIRKSDFARCFKAKKREFSPAIRHNYPVDLKAIEIEAPPARKQPEKASIALAAGPALTMAVPILLGCGRQISIITSVFAAFWAVSNVLGRHRNLKNEERRRRNSYIAYIEECEDRIRARYDEIIKSWELAFPTVDKYLNGGGNPFLLWNKDDCDAQRNSIRLGLGRVSFPVEIVTPKERFAQIDDSLKSLPGKVRDKYLYIENGVILIDFSITAMVGIVYTDVKELNAFVAALILQFLVSYRPDSISISFDIDMKELKSALYFMRFLDTAGEEDDKLKRLVITDRPEALTDYAVSNNTNVIFVTDHLKKLPSYIDILISLSVNSSYLMKLRDSENRRINIKADRIEPVLADEYVRMLLHLAGKSSRIDKTVADKVDFMDIAPSTTVESIIYSWKSSNTAKDIGILLGSGEGGKLISLNLHERKHGPHGIIAGTTGSGKSELLTTLILSAALSFPPDKLGFFLIDYKGGGMANLFNGLPHLMGNISNLSIEESLRAQASLKSENMRRQQIFNDCGVNNISDYTIGYDEGRFKEPLPHILIIIDEFAELKKEQPDFMQQLISVAAIGRSLGIHLILATQKPSGVIDDKIRSNSKFRIALRVEDRADSNDILKKEDAAFIRNVGRAYLQVGNDELYEYFQCAYAMGPVSKDLNDKLDVFDERMHRIEAVSSNTIYDKMEEKEEENCLSFLLHKVIEAEHRLACNSPRKLWRDALPAKISIEENIDDIICGDEESGSLKTDNLIAIMDSPASQSYEYLFVDCKGLEHTCVIGPVLSGKSNFLRTCLAALISSGAASEVLIIDFGGGMLRGFSRSNKCAGYISNDEAKRIPMMLIYIKEKLEEARIRMRHRTDCKGGGSRYEEKTENIIFIVDNYGEAFRDYPELSLAVISDVLKYGKSVGIFLLCSASGTGSSEIPSRCMDKIEKVYTLGRMDSYIAAGLLRCPMRQLPQIADFSGRGIGVYEGRALEFQTLLYSDSSISHVIDKDNSVHQIKKVSYPYIPDEPKLEEFLERAVKETSREEIIKSGMLPLGYEERSGKLYKLPIGHLSMITIDGRAGSGKSNFLSVIKNTSARFGINVISINSINVLIQYLKDKDQIADPTIFIIKDFEAILDALEAYEDTQDKNYAKELLIRSFDNSACTNSNITIAAIVTDRLKINIKDYGIYEVIAKKVYGIRFGGGLDEDRLLDFSYLPYSQQSIRKNPGQATVARYQRNTFYGDIIVPLSIEKEVIDDWY